MDLTALTVPASILHGARYVASTADDVAIDMDSLSPLSGRIAARLALGTDDIETAFGSAGTLARDVNLVFFETACNFFFWTERAGHKWEADLGSRTVGGWYGLAGCFHRAVQAGIPVYDAAWMANLTLERARELFAGTGSPIPMVEQRVNNVVEGANYLLQKYGGQVLNLLADSNFSAPRITANMVRDLPSFRDGAWYRGQWVWILKRAQILPSDLAQLSSRYSEFDIADCDQLTAFADYRLPQVLRHYGVLEYSAGLASVIAAGTILPAGSRQEVEIRTCTIEACEQLKRYLPGVNSADIDLGLWLMSQDLRTDPTLSPITARRASSTEDAG